MKREDGLDNLTRVQRNSTGWVLQKKKPIIKGRREETGIHNLTHRRSDPEGEKIKTGNVKKGKKYEYPFCCTKRVSKGCGNRSYTKGTFEKKKTSTAKGIEPRINFKAKTRGKGVKLGKDQGREKRIALSRVGGGLVLLGLGLCGGGGFLVGHAVLLRSTSNRELRRGGGVQIKIYNFH